MSDKFQVKPPRGGIGLHQAPRPAAERFKSCPREGASRLLPHPVAGLACFKSCPREGASAALIRAGWLDEVSSHAPVRGHLADCEDLGRDLLVSSHAPVRGHHVRPQDKAEVRRFKSCPREGASCRPRRRTRSHCRFKSCPREGASPEPDGRPVAQAVSSHAPVRGHLQIYTK